MGNKGHGQTLRLILVYRDGFYGFIFWSIFQALAPMIWFYPLNELEISGFEVFAVVWMSPILLLIPGLWSLLQNHWVLIGLRLLVIGSLASFQASATLSRLIILSAGTAISMLVLAAMLWSNDRWIRYRTFRGLMIGLYGLLASRIWFKTINPTWWTNNSNSVVIAIGIITIVAECFEAHEPEPAPLKPKKWTNHWVPCGIGLGSLLFLTHLYCGEVSVVTRWTVRGYPDTGPLPLPWGSVVLLTAAAGSIIGIKSSYYRDLFAATILSCSSFILLLVSNPYIAFAGGLCAAYLTMALWPIVVDKVTQSHPIGCLTLAAAVYVMQVLFWVWTITFNFVPYGEYTREHTDWLLACLGTFILICFLTCHSMEPVSSTPCDNQKTTSQLQKSYCYVILVIMLVGQAGMFWRYQNYTPGVTVQTRNNSKVFSAGVWTYHFGYDNRGWPSMERTAQLINDSEVDVMTLLESDASKLFLGNNDLATWMAETLQMYVDFGPSTKDHTYGNLILSKYPIVKSTHHLLPSPEGELAPAVTVSINIQGVVVDFVVTHMGNEQDMLDRELQTEFLANELKNTSNPAVFLGYMTTYVDSPYYWYMRKKGGVRDIDPDDEERFCQYIFYKKLIRLGYARISHGGLSDTEVQLARFKIPDNFEDKIMDNRKTTVNSKHEKVDPAHVFTRKFGRFYPIHGNFDDHGYHMGTPKYFYS